MRLDSLTRSAKDPSHPPTSLRGERAESLVITVSHTGPEMQTSVCNKQPEESLLHLVPSLLCRHCGEQAPCWTCTIFGTRLTEGSRTSQIRSNTRYDEVTLPFDLSALEVKRTFGNYIFCINYITISVLSNVDHEQVVLAVWTLVML